jgi:cytoskeletal protein RodZ
MASVGSVLRTEREAQGRAIEDIAQELCVMPSYLRAMENDNLALLPGIFFYKSFVRQYAALLGLNPGDLQAGVNALTAAAEPQPEPATVLPQRKPIRVPDPIVQAANRLDLSARSLTMPAVALVAALIGGAMFFSWWKQPAPQLAADPETTVANVLAATAEGSKPVVNVTTTTGDDGVRHIELSISATEETWIAVTSEGKSVFSGVLQPEQTKVLSGLEMARLRVGNAGALNVQVNGKEIGPLGERGQVRVVVVTPEGFNILPATTNLIPAETL